MGDEELQRFLSLSVDKVTEKYAQVINKREWVLNRPTRHRAGAFWPKGGFRSLSLKSEFVEKGTKPEIRGKIFDEIECFKLSAIGELASKPKCPSLPGKHILICNFFL